MGLLWDLIGLVATTYIIIDWILIKTGYKKVGK